MSRGCACVTGSEMDNPRHRPEGDRQRVRVAIKGAVQGVGFRPFVYRLATTLNLAGWVSNSGHGVLIEAEGDHARLQEFLVRLSSERPPRSFIQSLEPTFLDPVGFDGFVIRPSLDAGAPSALVVPDIALCDECLREMLDPADRRHRYPFINCTNCGPRFSIIEALPYDRPNTTMRAFAMCEQCREEYEDPANRRFHAQPNACPRCGPHVRLWDGEGVEIAARDEALREAAAAIRAGRIVAIKGIGGFQLVVDGRNRAAVATLRARKAREEKPFALMYPTIDCVRVDCVVSPLEERLLRSAEAPIVLLKRRSASAGRAQADDQVRRGTGIVDDLAPGIPELGVMLPYTPLHHLLVRELGFPIVATSGNRSDEPICIDENEALERLAGIADLFLVHDRPIARHVDDSVARVALGRELVLRRARGYAPLPVTLERGGAAIVAVGAHLKNTIAAFVDRHVFVSQHIGDLETEQAYHAFSKVIADFERLYAFAPATIACDAHPDYLSTAYARQSRVPVVTVQHHVAHVLACLAENELRGPVLGVSWDGTGFGNDGTIWGGEFLLVTERASDRVAALRTFALPGGEQAVKEPRRSALGLLFDTFGDDLSRWGHLAPASTFSSTELTVIRDLLARGVNAPRTSSAGRLFDGVASLTGLHQRVRYEGQAAMALQFAADPAIDDAYEIGLVGQVGRVRQVGPVRNETGSDARTPARSDARTFEGSDDRFIVLDWSPMVRQIVDDVQRGVATGTVAARFHNGLVRAIVDVASQVGEEQVVLTGGCFQNVLLLERTVRQLHAAGFRSYWHQRIPPNDGGISLGQVVAALRAKGQEPRAE